MKRLLEKQLERIKNNQRLKNLSKAASISVLNQFVSSGTNFALGLYLVRTLSYADFGLYSIGFAISLFYAGIGSAMFLTQMVVNVPDREPDQRAAYVASMGAADAAFCALTFVIVLVSLPLGGVALPWLEQYVELGIAIAAASGAYHFKELFTRYSYTARKEIWALWVNLVVSATLIGLLIAHYASEMPMSAAGALWIYAVAQLAGVLAGQLIARLPFSKVSIKEIINDVKEAWVGARWALPTAIIYTLRGQAHTIVTAALAGPVGVAFLSASRLLVTPAIFVMPALSQVVLPRFATARTKDKASVLRLGAQYTGAILAVSVFYSFVLLVFLEPITMLALGEKYTPDMNLAFAWCVYIVVHVVCINGTMVAQVLKRFKSVMMLSMSTVIVMLCAIYVCYKMLGVPGIIYGMAISDVFLSIIAWRLIVVECRK